MSKQIFKSINSTINFYQNQLLKPEENIYLAMFPHLRELTTLKIEIFNKLLELIGNKDDIYYEEFYNKYFKDYTFISFSDMDDFILALMEKI
jgi:hypothetical protein